MGRSRSAFRRELKKKMDIKNQLRDMNKSPLYLKFMNVIDANPCCGFDDLDKKIRDKLCFAYATHLTKNENKLLLDIGLREKFVSQVRDWTKCYYEDLVSQKERIEEEELY